MSVGGELVFRIDCRCREQLVEVAIIESHQKAENRRKTRKAVVETRGNARGNNRDRARSMKAGIK